MAISPFWHDHPHSMGNKPCVDHIVNKLINVKYIMNKLISNGYIHNNSLLITFNNISSKILQIYHDIPTSCLLLKASWRHRHLPFRHLKQKQGLAESQKPLGLPSIGADEGVRIHILSGRACKTYVKLIWNIHIYVGGTYVMRM